MHFLIDDEVAIKGKIIAILGDKSVEIKSRHFSISVITHPSNVDLVYRPPKEKAEILKQDFISTIQKLENSQILTIEDAWNELSKKV